MDEQKLQELFEEKYEERLGETFGQWLENAPKNEAEGYKRLNEIDEELNSTYETWFDSEGKEKEEMEEHRQKLKAEYDLLEELFGLEAKDKNW